MDIEGKWVHFDDTLELEIFLNLCEDQDVKWREIENPNDEYPPREFLESDLNLFRSNFRDIPISCGYIIVDNCLYDVYGEQCKWWSDERVATEENRFCIGDL